MKRDLFYPKTRLFGTSGLIRTDDPPVNSASERVFNIDFCACLLAYKTLYFLLERGLLCLLKPKNSFKHDFSDYQSLTILKQF